MSNSRKIRFPNSTIEFLRDLRDSYYSPRPVPKLINAALRQTRNVVVSPKTKTTTRDDSESIEVVLDPEFSHLESAEVRDRVQFALDQLPRDCVDHEMIKINRY